MAGKNRAVGIVEGTSKGTADGRPRRRNDDGFSHGGAPSDLRSLSTVDRTLRLASRWRNIAKSGRAEEVRYYGEVKPKKLR